MTMNNIMQVFTGNIFLFLSAAIFISGVFYFIKNIIVKKSAGSTYYLAMTSVFEILALAALSAWFISIGQLEKSPSFLVNILQYFSLDAGYEAIHSDATLIVPVIRKIATVHMFFVYSAAPILGGAFIYDIVAGTAPRLRLLFIRWKNLYVFSELNERTIALAADIKRVKKSEGEKFALVFTDVYGTKSSESFSEILQDAKALGAICLQEDILNCSGINKSKECKFFLLDEDSNGEIDESNNLMTLIGLLDMQNASLTETDRKISNSASHNTTVLGMKNPCSIFIYSNDNNSIESISSIMEEYNNGSGLTEKEKAKVNLYVVRDLARTAEFLLIDHPLYEPIDTVSDDPVKNADDNKKNIRIAIFGNTVFSREIFKAIFWCGQMLNTQLHITTIYKPSEEHAESGRSEFEDYLDKLSPEIIESCRQPSPDYAPECLRLFGSPGDEFRKENFSEPYAILNFIEADAYNMNLTSFLACSCYDDFADQGIQVFGENGADTTCPLYDYDYYFVMNGSDLENIQFASDLRKSIIHHQIEKPRRGRANQQIAVAVHNDEMALIAEKDFDNDSFIDETESVLGSAIAPIIFTFGTMSERFTWDTAYCTFEDLLAYRRDPESSQREHGKSPNKPISQRAKIYDEWSVESHSAHEKYKLFSAKTSGAKNKEEQLIKELAWLEHRRWNAFIRVQGFSAPFDKIQTAIDLFNSDPDSFPKVYKSKSIMSKLHPCLVEASKERMIEGAHLQKDKRLLDSLDWVSWFTSRDEKPKDYKVYDIKRVKKFVEKQL